jgi:hypothetical protein
MRVILKTVLKAGFDMCPKENRPMTAKETLNINFVADIGIFLLRKSKFVLKKHAETL